MTLLQLAQLVIDAAAFGGQHLDLLLHLGHRAALLVAARLSLALRGLQTRHALRLLMRLRSLQLRLLFGCQHRRRDAFQLGSGFGLTSRPLVVLRLQLGQPGLRALASLDHVADALFEPAHLECSLGQLALALVQCIAAGIVRLAHGFHVGLDLAQLGDACFQRGGGIEQRGMHALLFLRRVAVLQEPELLLLQRGLFLQRAVGLRHLGLLFQLVEVGIQLAQDVVDAGQVLARVLQPALGFAAPLLVLGHAGGFFEEQPQLFGARLDDAADRALADDGVGARPQARAHEHVLHVAAAHRLVVDVVAAAAVTRQHALDGDLAELVPRPAGACVAVVEDQLDAGPSGRLAQARAVEDDVLHRFAAQLAGLAFAQHPAHRVHDVGLAATVGADHADALARQGKGGRIAEGLEAGELDLVKAHGGPAAAFRA